MQRESRDREAETNAMRSVQMPDEAEVVDRAPDPSDDQERSTGEEKGKAIRLSGPEYLLVSVTNGLKG